MSATLAGAVRARARRLRRTRRPLPPVTIPLGPWVPGWVLRAAAAAATGTLVLLTAGRAPLIPALAVGLTLVLAAWAAARPGPGPAHVAVVLSAVVLLGSPAAPFDPAVTWLAPLGYVAVRLSWWAGWVGPRVRVEVAALRRSASRDLVVVAVSVPVGLLAWSFAGRPAEALVGLGVVALAALAWLVVRRHDGG